MKKFILFLRLKKRALWIAVAATISLGAIGAYAAVSHHTATPAAAPTPTATLDLPTPTEPQYPGRTGEDHHGAKIYTPGPSATPDPEVITVAREFATAWARPDLGREAWLDGVDEHGTNDYIRPLSTTINPRNVPATAVTGDPTIVEQRTDQAVVDVPTDAGTLRLTLVSLVGQWWVTYTDWTETARDR